VREKSMYQIALDLAVSARTLWGEQHTAVRSSTRVVDAG
jgi:hypothetical protein